MRDQKFIIKGETQVVKISALPDSTPGERDLAELAKIKYLQIPRKPAWKGKTLEEQKIEQNTAFLDWRKHLGSLQDTLPDAILTPYEKNFEVWKQLWYVVEKSDLLIQIIDCRDPLFYRCEDLENYVTESGKQNFLLINKADLVPQSVRRTISDYLKSHHRSHAFFSAKLEQELIEKELEKELMAEAGPREVETDSEDEEAQQKAKKKQNRNKNKVLDDLKPEPEPTAKPKDKAAAKEPKKPDYSNDYYLEYFKSRINTENMLGREELLSFFEFYARNKSKVHLHDLNITIDPPAENTAEKQLKTEAEAKEEEESHKAIIGMVGYPNVGKSSVINACFGKKKVGVDIKPGKTKNLQTIMFSQNVTLCDCPGLIFPSLVSSKAEMICNGVISVESVMEYIDPINYILQTVPNLLLKYLYKLPLNFKTTEAETLETHYKNQFKNLDFKQLVEEQDLNPIGPTQSTDDHRMTARAFLQLFAATRGYVTGAALPDEAKSAKMIIKDYLQGRIPHFKVPEESQFVKALEFDKITEELKAKYSHAMAIKNLKSEDLIVNQQLMSEEKAEKDLQIIADVDGEERNRKIEFLTRMDENDIVELIEGKTVEGIKLQKGERRELKFLVKGDAKTEQIVALLKSFLFKPKDPKMKR